MRITRNVLLLGLRRSGKTSISKVVFGNMDPSQTQYLHATYAVTPTQISAEALAKFTILDFPGQEDVVAKDIAGMRSQMRSCGALVFVLDCTDYNPSTGGGRRIDYEEAINRLVLVVQQMYVVAEPDQLRIVDVFLHKADKLTSEHQRGVQEEVRQQLQYRLNSRLTPDLEQRRVVVQYHLTSIFDHSVFYAFSLVARRVIPNIMHIQSAMQVCCNNSHVLSYFLFGISRRMFIASANVADDRRPTERDVLEYECCSDVVDFFQSMHTFVAEKKPQWRRALAAPASQGKDGEGKGDGGGASAATDGAGVDGLPASPSYSPNGGMGSPNDTSAVAAAAASLIANGKQHKSGAGDDQQKAEAAAAAASNAGAADTSALSGVLEGCASAVFRFPSARATDSIKPVYLVRELGPLLTLVVAVKPEHVECMRPAIEYNLTLLQNALMQILVENERTLVDFV
jgi:hypothetical protein